MPLDYPPPPGPTPTPSPVPARGPTTVRASDYLTNYIAVVDEVAKTETMTFDTVSAMLTELRDEVAASEIETSG